MHNPFAPILARLSVSRKLVLIYLLDLTAVIFVSGILINEKYIAINFARDELRGNAYIAALRDALIDVAGAGTHPAPRLRVILRERADVLARTERELGEDMGTAALGQGFATALRSVADTAPGDIPPVRDALVKGRDLTTRVGNQSKLILDPDLDSYYTMSLDILRYPELLEIVYDVGALLDRSVLQPRANRGDVRTQYLILEGRLDAVAHGIQTDLSEAGAAGGATVQQNLAPSHALLNARIDAFRVVARNVIDSGADLTAATAAQLGLMQQLSTTWAESGRELDRLLEARISGLFSRMWLHLGAAAFLLLIILSIVYLVARAIAFPLQQLSRVADKVRQTGDYSLRGDWRSEDEIGRLVLGFNGMLEQLDRDREVQKELAANARAAVAQQALVEATPIPIVVTSVPGHEVLHANEPARHWLGESKGDPWAFGLEPSVRARFFQRLADHDAVDEFEVRWLAGAEPSWAVLSARRMKYHGQDAVLTAFAPINHLKQMEQRLELWAKVFEASSEGIMIVNADERVMSVNRAFVKATGYEFHEVIGEKPDFLLGGEGPSLFHELWSATLHRGAWQGEVAMNHRNGGVLPVWMMISLVRAAGGMPAYYICTSIDISERKKNEERIQFLAHHDVLTNLPNRSLCIERLRLAMQQSARSKLKVAVMFIDLDRFKNINDSLGHHIGDALLRSVAQRLVEAVRAHDTVSRLGGDEFVVVLNGVQDQDEVTRIVEGRLIPLIRRVHRIGEAELNISCSIGIVMFPDHATTIDELMRLADLAMYHAKAEGRNAARFLSRDMTERVTRRVLIEAKLRQAIANGEFTLHYQPRIDGPSGRLAGAEALLRWSEPELGNVEPAQFIPIAEETGLIVPIGEWVIEQACAQMAAWRDQGIGEIRVAVNLSAAQLRDPGLIDFLSSSIARHGIDAGALEIEITESILMEEGESNLLKLRAIRNLGVILTIDDFGTGYSSLAYLSRFPINKLKIDRSFVHQMEDDPTNLAITRAIIGLGHTLGLLVVAEGIETEGEVSLLQAAGCDEFQGYLFSRPQPASDFEKWMAASTRQARLFTAVAAA